MPLLCNQQLTPTEMGADFAKLPHDKKCLIPALVSERSGFLGESG